MTFSEALEEIREVAMKFYKGHTQEYRDSYKEGGWLDRLETAIARLKDFAPY